jgi:S-adenosylmethionine synthetase
MKIVDRPAESVTKGHPDKICDSIAAAILDEAIKRSKKSDVHPKVAMEVSVKGNQKTGGTLLLFGEVTLPRGVALDYDKIARRVIESIGYDKSEYGFHNGLPEVILRISQQSADIAHGVNRKKTGAGDQGLMFGGAVYETPELMPLPIMLAHGLTQGITACRVNKTLPYLKPDGKAQVVVRYINDKPTSVVSITIAASHDESVDTKTLKDDLKTYVIDPVLSKYGCPLDDDAELFINGAGRWTVFGPLADAGTTNRKIVVDTYGGYFPIGGGGLNGKDPTKVDLSGHLAARYIAKNVVAHKLCSKAQILLSYTIGQPSPQSITIDTFGTQKVSDQVLNSKVKELLDLSVDGIINGLSLFSPVYEQAASGGFFGRNEFPWEKVR